MPVDPKVILKSLGVAEFQALTPLGGAGDTAMWRIGSRGDVYALRIFDPSLGSQCNREVSVMQAARNSGILVPEVVAQIVWHDHAALLLEWCPGQTVKDAVLRRPWWARRYGKLFGEMQAKIHLIPAPEILLEESRSWLRWKASNEVGERSQLRPGDSHSLLHLDYHPLNVMTDGYRITGVLDWANASYGEPQADMARTVTILRFNIAILATPRSLRLPVKALIHSFESGWRSGYEQVAGL